MGIDACAMRAFSGSGDDTTMTYRLGVSYEIELSRLKISPALNVDGEQSGGLAIVYGLSFGFGF